jgi:hypothetical protein
VLSTGDLMEFDAECASEDVELIEFGTVSRACGLFKQKNTSMCLI